MQKNSLKDWWYEEGCGKLNCFLVNYSGISRKFVSLRSILGNSLDLSSRCQDELTGILIQDGCYVKSRLYADGTKEVFIYINK